ADGGPGRLVGALGHGAAAARRRAAGPGRHRGDARQPRLRLRRPHHPHVRRPRRARGGPRGDAGGVTLFACGFADPRETPSAEDTSSEVQPMRKILIPLVSLGLLSFAVLHVVRAQQKLPDVKPPVEPARSPFARTVAGAGIVEARTENISLGSPLPGVVDKVFVKVGDPVKVGDKLFQLDARALTAELAYRHAALAAAQAPPPPPR